MFKRKYIKKISTGIILTFWIFCTISITSPDGFDTLKTLGTAHASPAGLYPLNITVNPGANYERIIFASHGATLADGNWIELSQGIPMDIPSTSFEFSGITTTEFTEDGNTINFTQNLDTGSLTYPLTTHHVYVPGMSINATFWGNSALAGEDVNFTLHKVTSLTKYRQIFNDTLRGDLTNLRDNLTNPYRSSTKTLDTNGDASWVISPDPGAGDYLLLISKEIGATTPYDLYIYSMTVVQVLDYSCTITASSSVQKGNFLNVNIALGSGASGTFRYGAFLIKQSAYTAQLKLSFDGTKLGTNLTINGVLIANGSLADAFALGTKGLSYFTPAQITSIISSGFGSNKVSVGITSSTSSTTGSTSLGTSNLQVGTYILLAGAWENNDYFVAFNQSTISVTSPPSPPPPPPPRPPPPANQNPVAVATVCCLKALVGQEIIFNSENSYDSDGVIDITLWIFDDGDTSTNSNVTHTYDEPGIYNVTLTVLDNNGASNSTWVIITVTELPLTPSQLQETTVPANATNHIIDATSVANTTLSVNTTDPVTLTIVKYPENPHPEATLPDNALPYFIDIFVGNPEAVIWPIYIEVEYSDNDIVGLNENELALYYFKDGTWHKAQETGVYPNENIVWANLYQDELTGSPLIIVGVVALPAPAEFQLSNLEISPEQAYTNEEVTITFDIANVGETTGNYTATLKIDDEIEKTWNLTIPAGESQTLSHTLTRDEPGTYIVQADILASSFDLLTIAEFQYLLSTPSPAEAELGENVTIDITVTNVGTGLGTYKFNLQLDGENITTYTGELTPGSSEDITATVSSQTLGAHTINVNEQHKTFIVYRPAEFFYTIESILPKTVKPGEAVTVNIRIENIGGTTGSYEVDVTLDGELVDSYIGELESGESKSVSSEMTSDTEGFHTVEVYGISRLFVVEKPAGLSWMQTNLILLAIVLVIAIVIYYLNQKGIISF